MAKGMALTIGLNAVDPKHYEGRSGKLNACEADSESFEGGVRTPLVGMEKYFNEEVQSLALPNVKAWVAPSPATGSTTHGGFDDDSATMSSVIALIKGKMV